MSRHERPHLVDRSQCRLANRAIVVEDDRSDMVATRLCNRAQMEAFLNSAARRKMSLFHLHSTKGGDNKIMPLFSPTHSLSVQRTFKRMLRIVCKTLNVIRLELAQRFKILLHQSAKIGGRYIIHRRGVPLTKCSCCCEKSDGLPPFTAIAAIWARTEFASELPTTSLTGEFGRRSGGAGSSRTMCRPSKWALRTVMHGL